jgi:GDPmannose 4,6-dehydratase
VKIDPRYFRPLETELLVANASKAREKLGWEPRVTFKELVRIMVDADMEAVGLEPRGEGKRILAKYGMNLVDKALINPTIREETV